MRTVLRETGMVQHAPRGRPVLGIIGGGQLARMMVEAAIRLDVDVRVLAASPDDSAAQVAPEVILGDHDDLAAVLRLARSCDVVTFEHERTSGAVIEAIEASGARLRPGSEAMRRASDKVLQRQLAEAVGMEVASHDVVVGPSRLRTVVDRVGLPLVAKASLGGYDGRGVRWLRTTTDVDDLAQLLDADPTAWVVEPALAIEVELAVQIARRPDGEVAVYPVVETTQEAGICTSVAAPAPTDDGPADELVGAALRLADELDLVGILAVEAFVVDGRLLLNELAPRPHNSGHYTIDACTTSQFENHVRAVLDLPLGDTAMVAPSAVMANVIARGPMLTALRDVRVPAGTSIHLYGKHPRPGRKVGHVTTVGDRAATLARAALETADAIARPSRPSGGPEPEEDRT